jgi:hypothetical protein
MELDSAAVTPATDASIVVVELQQNAELFSDTAHPKLAKTHASGLYQKKSPYSLDSRNSR